MSEAFLVVRRIKRYIITNIRRSDVTLPDFNQTWFLSRFLKNNKIKFHKIRAVEAELFHEDGLTDRHYEANSRFSQFFEGAEKRK
jgi:hypothetical protein